VIIFDHWRIHSIYRLGGDNHLPLRLTSAATLS
jgi:hypothetical protein